MNRKSTQVPGAPTAGERRKMVEIAAYFLAEHRGFAPGGADADWRRAEQAIDALITDGLAGGLGGDSVESATVTRRIRNALKLGRGRSGGRSARSGEE